MSIARTEAPKPNSITSSPYFDLRHDSNPLELGALTRTFDLMDFSLRQGGALTTTGIYSLLPPALRAPSAIYGLTIIPSQHIRHGGNILLSLELGVDKEDNKEKVLLIPPNYIDAIARLLHPDDYPSLTTDQVQDLDNYHPPVPRVIDMNQLISAYAHLAKRIYKSIGIANTHSFPFIAQSIMVQHAENHINFLKTINL